MYQYFVAHFNELFGSLYSIAKVPITSLNEISKSISIHHIVGRIQNENGQRLCNESFTDKEKSIHCKIGWIN